MKHFRRFLLAAALVIMLPVVICYSDQIEKSVVATRKVPNGARYGITFRN